MYFYKNFISKIDSFKRKKSIKIIAQRYKKDLYLCKVYFSLKLTYKIIYLNLYLFTMYTFVLAIFCLVLGYFIYGRFVEKTFGVDSKRETPCFTMNDGVDYIPMPTWKIFLIQFLNIAGTGPIFGAIMGILFGPAAFLWIVFGCIFAGAVHDFLSAMISIRENGASLPEIIGKELGPIAKFALRIFTMILMIMVGAVFVKTPADLLANLMSGSEFWGNPIVWCGIVFAYYILATLLPIDALIGRIYPIFGIALLIMAIGVFFGIFIHEGQIPEITSNITNLHPKELPIFPMMFISIACGAISGFHATQSPMMGRCLKNEKYARPIFYGAMITEGLVALIWAAAAIKFGDSLEGTGTAYEKLSAYMVNGGPAAVVNAICNNWIGTLGATLAILGVVAAPITSGDTALRSARLMFAEMLNINQQNLIKRLLVSLPIFIASGALMLFNFDVLWRYFSWFNQTLSIFTLWAITVWMVRNGRNHYWISMIPALWMTMVCMTYIVIAPEGLGLPHIYGYGFGLLMVSICLTLFIRWKKQLSNPSLPKI